MSDPWDSTISSWVTRGWPKRDAWTNTINIWAIIGLFMALSSHGGHMGSTWATRGRSTAIDRPRVAHGFEILAHGPPIGHL